MTKLACSAIALAAVSLGAVPAAAQDFGVYVRGAVGGAVSRDVEGGLAQNRGFGGDLGETLVLEAAVGLATPFSVRIEAALSHRPGLGGDGRATVAGATVSSKADIASTALLAQAFYDLPRVWLITPYVGAGLGIAVNDMDDVRRAVASGGFGTVDLPAEKGTSETRFAWALLAGAALDLGDGLAVDLYYRYLDAGEARASGQDAAGVALGGRLEAEIRTHELLAGLRWRF